jgi:hypothetical protein
MIGASETAAINSTNGSEALCVMSDEFKSTGECPFAVYSPHTA